ncbi:MAG: DUF1127 domain-containing protein [Pseudomonadota bacterium]
MYALARSEHDYPPQTAAQDSRPVGSVDGAGAAIKPTTGRDVFVGLARSNHDELLGLNLGWFEVDRRSIATGMLSGYTPRWIGNTLTRPGLPHLMAALWQGFTALRRRSNARRRAQYTAAALQELSNDTLKDIGIHRSEIAVVAARMQDALLEDRHG